ncbi:MAG: hypothetical protein V1816_26615 [Pseudomonadota bacterium]
MKVEATGLWSMAFFSFLILLSACGSLNNGTAGEPEEVIAAKIWKGELKPGGYVPNQVLVKFREGITPERAMEMVAQWGYGVIGRPGQAQVVWNRWLSASLPPQTDVRQAMRKAASQVEVEFAQPNLIIKME